jgi:hypothetical protein
VILDTEGNSFGGFTPVEWESRVHNEKFDNEDNGIRADDSDTQLGFSSTNDTGLVQRIVFTGSMYFQAKEIEIFEITD